MQPLNCISFLLGLAILSATLGPFVAIAHRELLSVTGSKGGAEIKLELSVDKIGTDEEVRSNVLTGRRLAFGDAVMEQKETKNSGSRTSSGENKNYSTNSRVPSNIKLVQDSPARKYRPTEIGLVNKIGKFFCPMTTSSSDSVFSTAASGLGRDPEHKPSLKISQASSGVLGVHNVNGELDVHIVQSVPNQASSICQAGNIEQDANLQPAEMINDGSYPQASKKPSQELIELPPNRGDLLSSTLNCLHRVCFRCLGADHFIKDCMSAFRCLYCYNYGHRAKYCVKRRLDLRHKWAPKKKSLAANKEIEWALNPNAPNDPLVLNTVQGSLTCCISQLHPSRPFNPVPEGEFAGLPSVTADSQHFHMGEGQSSEIIVGDQPIEEQNVIPEISHHKLVLRATTYKWCVLSQLLCLPGFRERTSPICCLKVLGR
ncbi:unnamed protein product [Miscanthus lutarioriparius]|uniref:CCHC-type domain-containing protein n=1 Tax=Miscanthus lutarioriparius TaxID=422564 RepID=A0A811S5C9_9POAL|nr:unnamed protein product [Miscanthus lutarioriparius]